VVRSGSQVTLIDCGWDRRRGLSTGADRYSRIDVEERDPVDPLARIGVAPRHVQNVIISHMHFDHVGNLDLFPDADLMIARSEYECWTGPYGEHPTLAHAVRRGEVRTVQGYASSGRLRLVDGIEEVLPGVIANPVGGHTPGQMIVEVATSAGAVLIASDAVHYHEELVESQPFYIYSDLIDMFDTYALLRARAAGRKHMGRVRTRSDRDEPVRTGG
jgi:glyoxylase-like metal-dependent hydrolase (beta-lactamase superfamily II)